MSHPELDLEKKVYQGPEYKLVRQYAEADPTLALNGTASCDFILPQKCISLAKSVLSFTVNVPVSANLASKFHSGKATPIQSVQLKTRSGIVIADVKDVGNYTTLVWPSCTKQEDFLQMPATHSAATEATALEQGPLFNKTIGPAGSNANGVFTPQINLDGDGAEASVDPSTGIQKVISSADNATHYVRVKLPLGMLYHSAFAMKSPIMFPEQMVLSVEFQQGVRMGYTTTAEADYTAVANYAVLPVLSSLRLYLAVCQSAQVIADWQALLAKGHTITIPYVHSYKYQASAGSNSITRRLNAGHGQRLLRNYVGVFHNTESGANSFNNCNTAHGTWTALQTSLDSQPLQDYSMSNVDREPFLNLQDKFKGNVIQSANFYDQGPVWVDDWTGAPAVDWPDKDINNIAGLPLTNRDIDYSIDLTAVGNQKVYVFSVCQKELILSMNGTQIL